MNAENLIRHYSRVIDAPEAVGRLRQFFVQLAVRGLLDDEKLNVRTLVPNGEIGSARSDMTPRTASEMIPFDFPAHWRAKKLVDIAEVGYGFAFPSDQFNSEKRGMPLIRIRDISSAETITYFEGAYAANYVVNRGDYLVGMDGDFNLRKWSGRDALLNQRVMRIREWSQDAYAEFVKLPLQLILNDLHSKTSFATVKHLSAKQVNRIVIPLPPLAEQHRIVAKVDELMALCDQLEEARAERERVRDRLTSASLARLDKPDVETFRIDAHFAIEVLPTLTARPDQIKRLRKTILSLAVRGKLERQDPTDEPAQELLARIARETTKSTLRHKVRVSKNLSPIDLDMAPFDLPSGWAWARFPELGEFGRGKSKHRPRNDPALYEAGTHPVIQTGDVARSDGSIRTQTSKYNEFGLSQSLKWPKGTLCITIAANIADSGILTFDACFPDSVVGFIAAPILASARYFEYFVRTAKADLLEFAPATAQKNINLEILNAVMIPVPPLAEQTRIVEKVDKMMRICDGLEASLRAEHSARALLLESLIAEAHATSDLGSLSLEKTS